MTSNKWDIEKVDNLLKRGVSFQIPNKYGKYLAQILEPLDCTPYDWKIECSTEVWKRAYGQRDEDLFDNANVVDGVIFDELIKSNIYYVIFTTLKAFPKGTHLNNFDTYEEFLKSDCELCLLIADCSYVELYCKNLTILEKLYDNARAKEYEGIECIDENDPRTKMCT